MKLIYLYDVSLGLHVCNLSQSDTTCSIYMYKTDLRCIMSQVCVQVYCLWLWVWVWVWVHISILKSKSSKVCISTSGELWHIIVSTDPFWWVWIQASTRKVWIWCRTHLKSDMRHVHSINICIYKWNVTCTTATCTIPI